MASSKAAMITDSSSLGTSPTHRWVRLGLVIALAALVAVGILPAYLSGQWPWVTAFQAPYLEHLQTLQDRALPLPGWVPTSHQLVVMNQQDWVVTEYQRKPAELIQETEATPPVQQIALLMHPQPWHSDQPELEWLDINSAQGLKPSFKRMVALTVTRDQQPMTARASFARSRNQQYTFATLQWYAWPDGGHPSPAAWFWTNQGSQLTRQALTPWVAVSVLIPMEPLAEVQTYQPLAIELGSAIQQQLVSEVFTSSED
jgi:cyanoexosortase B-associated protein